MLENPSAERPAASGLPAELSTVRSTGRSLSHRHRPDRDGQLAASLWTTPIRLATRPRSECPPVDTHRACILLGIIITCRAVGVPCQAYLTWAFERLGSHREHFGLALEQLTPAAFKATLR